MPKMVRSDNWPRCDINALCSSMYFPCSRAANAARAVPLSSSATSAAEGVAVDAAGNVYGAEVGPRALKKYVKE